MAKKRLGIDALFQTAIPRAVPETGVTTEHEVVLDRLTPRARQPRARFDDAALGELTESVRAHGVLQPLLVRPAGAGTYEIVAGERRWRAARAAGLTHVPVRVLELSDADVVAVAMVENLQREDLNPLEEAEGYIELLRLRLLDEAAFGPFADSEDPRGGVLRLLRALNNRAAGNTKDNVVLTLEPAVREVFGRVGRIAWPSFVAHRLPLLSLPEDVRDAMRTAGLEYTKARLIARVTAERLGDEARARRLRRDLIEQAATEGLSVRGLHTEVARLLDAARAGTGAPNRSRRSGQVATPRADLATQIITLRERLTALDLDALAPPLREALASSVNALLQTLGPGD